MKGEFEMDYLAWILTFAVVGYAVALTIKTGIPLYRYNKAKNRVVDIKGVISNFYGEDIVKRKGEIIKSFYPVYKYEVDGNKNILFGLVRYIGDRKEIIGQNVEMFYDGKTGEVWCKKDLPLMVKQIKIRLVTVVILLIVMIASSVLL